MSDHLKEEQQIMKEQDQVRSLTNEVFEAPVEELRMPRAIAMNEKSNISDVVKMMQKKRIGSIILTDDEGILSGIVTERDILLKVVGIFDKAELEKTPISKVMTEEPQTLRAGDEIAYVMNNMHAGGYRHIPIVNQEGEPLSIISIKDVLTYILDFFPSDVLNMVGEPYRGPKQREGA